MFQKYSKLIRNKNILLLSEQISMEIDGGLCQCEFFLNKGKRVKLKYGFPVSWTDGIRECLLNTPGTIILNALVTGQINH